MYRAGDQVKILIGALTGTVRTVHSVRMYATDKGYYVRGGEGLYGPDQVEFVAASPDGNPCGAPCDDRTHESAGYTHCDHCRGACHH